MTQVQCLEPLERWKERPNPTGLLSDLHMGVIAYITVVWVGHVFHGITGLNTWSLGSDAIWGGCELLGSNLLEKVSLRVGLEVL